jgi:hypothetical protein
MIRWFRRLSTRRLVSTSLRRVRPLLEPLEIRNCPVSPLGVAGFAEPTCVLASLNVTPEPAFEVHVSGTVTDPNPANCVVNLSGVLSGTASVNADGSFAADLKATGVGQVTGVAQDTLMQVSSAPVTVNVSVNPPEIENFAVIHNSDNTWTIRGTVVDLAPAGLTVVFGGPGNVQNATATCDNAGNFSFAVTISTTAPTFTISAIVTDSWDLQSAQVSQTCNNGG